MLVCRGILSNGYHWLADDVKHQHNISCAQNLVYDKQYTVNSTAVENILKEQSLVPTAVLNSLAPLGVNMYLMFVVDLMHEIELGVWKALITHLLRIVSSCNKKLLDEIDHRHREMPTFGTHTIRCFPSNRSEMREMAVHNFDDLFQACRFAVLYLFLV
ncbi:hypothetical protein SERLA73DRAFT_64123 [Serpula lacrymans var. lacrymans S7.3]|uniref:Uncharacterized protein n=1 Tax=Serpula lacrymans var. lacrymans (strain S7.3) TaxID=936435 RepID=F8QDX5_SERL3|nr:hypothetical protein SERLA73DRAFT_64123 [Serpula lacrymans var. lacrymans S7.3]